MVGLHSTANMDAIVDAFARRKIWESETEKSELLDLKNLQYRGPPPPSMEPQVNCFLHVCVGELMLVEIVRIYLLFP